MIVIIIITIIKNAGYFPYDKNKKDKERNGWVVRRKAES
jgi:hypothetical protein